MQAVRAIRPSLKEDVNRKVGYILLAHNLGRTFSPLIGGFFADKFQKLKLISIIGYVLGEFKMKYHAITLIASDVLTLTQKT